MIGVQDQRGVEDVLLTPAGRFAVQLVEEVARDVEVGSRGHRTQAAAEAVIGSDQRGHLGQQADGLALVGGAGHVGHVGVVERQQRDGGA